MEDRRGFIKAGLATGLGLAGLTSNAAAEVFASKPAAKPNKSFRILHMTDMHMRPEFEAPRRYKRIIGEVMENAGAMALLIFIQTVNSAINTAKPQMSKTVKFSNKSTQYGKIQWLH